MSRAPHPRNKEESIRVLLALIKEWGKTHNLMSRTGIQQAHLHVEDSLSIAKKIKKQIIVDMGSGAGFPGIPLAISLPKKTFYLVESNKKKAAFLLHAINRLDLKNTTVVAERMESFSLQQEGVEIVSRAFGGIDESINSAKYFLDKGSFLKLMRTEKGEIGEKFKKKYKIISSENIYSELRSRKNVLVTIGAV